MILAAVLCFSIIPYDFFVAEGTAAPIAAPTPVPIAPAAAPTQAPFTPGDYLTSIVIGAGAVGEDKSIIVATQKKQFENFDTAITGNGDISAFTFQMHWYSLGPFSYQYSVPGLAQILLTASPLDFPRSTR
jgi:hypothetical protein